MKKYKGVLFIEIDAFSEGNNPSEGDYWYTRVRMIDIRTDVPKELPNGWAQDFRDAERRVDAFLAEEVAEAAETIKKVCL